MPSKEVETSSSTVSQHKLYVELNNTDYPLDYVRRSSQLATEYFKLGKVSRAGNVFAQTYRTVLESKILVDSGVKVELLLRWSCYLAGTGDIVNA